jgi:hypothetical protein
MRSGGLHVAEGFARACGIAQMRVHEAPSAAFPLGTRPARTSAGSRDACLRWAKSPKPAKSLWQASFRAQP